MCVSDAWMNVNSACSGDRREREIDRRVVSSAAARMRPPRDSRRAPRRTARQSALRGSRYAPDASVATTASWFDTATFARPRSPLSRMPLPFASMNMTPETSSRCAREIFRNNHQTPSPIHVSACASAPPFKSRCIMANSCHAVRLVEAPSLVPASSAPTLRKEAKDAQHHTPGNETLGAYACTPRSPYRTLPASCAPRGRGEGRRGRHMADAIERPRDQVRKRERLAHRIDEEGQVHRVTERAVDTLG